MCTHFTGSSSSTQTYIHAALHSTYLATVSRDVHRCIGAHRKARKQLTLSFNLPVPLDYIAHTHTYIRSTARETSTYIHG